MENIDTCANEAPEAFLENINEKYVVDHFSNLTQKQEGFEFYKLPITQEEIGIFQNIKMKTYTQCDYYKSSDGLPGVVKKIYTETNTENLINNFVDEAIEECIDDSVDTKETSAFGKVLRDIIADSEDQMKETGKSLYRAKISLERNGPINTLLVKMTTPIIGATLWHTDSDSDYRSIITADLTFKNAHTIFLNSEHSKNAFDNNCTANSFCGDQDTLCVSLLNTTSPSKAPNGPYSTHFLDSQIHSAPPPIAFHNRLVLRLDFLPNTRQYFWR